MRKVIAVILGLVVSAVLTVVVLASFAVLAATAVAGTALANPANMPRTPSLPPFVDMNAADVGIDYLCKYAARRIDVSGTPSLKIDGEFFNGLYALIMASLTSDDPQPPVVPTGFRAAVHKSTLSLEIVIPVETNLPRLGAGVEGAATLKLYFRMAVSFGTERYKGNEVLSIRPSEAHIGALRLPLFVIRDIVAPLIARYEVRVPFFLTLRAKKLELLVDYRALFSSYLPAFTISDIEFGDDAIVFSGAFSRAATIDLFSAMRDELRNSGVELSALVSGGLSYEAKGFKHEFADFLEQVMTMEQLSPWSGKVSYVSGDAKLNGLYAWVGEELKEGYVLKTGTGGTIELQFGDGTKIKLGEGTELTMNRLVPEGGVMNRRFGLSVGTIRLLVPPLAAKESLVVETPAATVEIEGTDCVIAVEGDKGLKTNVLSGKGKLVFGSTGSKKGIVVDTGEFSSYSEKRPGKATKYSKEIGAKYFGSLAFKSTVTDVAAEMWGKALELGVMFLNLSESDRDAFMAIMDGNLSDSFKSKAYQIVQGYGYTE